MLSHVIRNRTLHRLLALGIAAVIFALPLFSCAHAVEASVFLLSEVEEEIEDGEGDRLESDFVELLAPQDSDRLSLRSAALERIVEVGIDDEIARSLAHLTRGPPRC